LLGIKETSSLCLFNHNCELAKSEEMKLAVTYLNYCVTGVIGRRSAHGAGTGVINFRQGHSEVFFTDCDQNKRDVNPNIGVMWHTVNRGARRCDCRSFMVANAI